MFQKKSHFNDLSKRILSALIFGLVALSALFYGGLIATLFLGMCLAVLCWEVFYIFSNGTTNSIGLILLIPSCVFLVPLLNYYNFYPVTVLLVCAFLSIFSYEKNILKFFCIMYVGLSVLTFQKILLSTSPFLGLNNLLLIITIVAASDVGGYFFGRVIGGPKIYEFISPNKTWAGSIGGILLALLVSLSLSSFFDYAFLQIILLASMLAVSAQAGDFFESWLKRKFKVKDSGFLLPGHGGIFDRLDGLLAAVLVYGAFMYAL